MRKVLLAGFLVLSLISFAESVGAESNNDSTILDKYKEYKQCRTLVLNSDITIWYHNSSSTPGYLDLYLSGATGERKQDLLHIKSEIARWGLNMDAWRKNIGRNIQAQASVKNVLYQKYDAKGLDSSDPFKTCGAEITVDIELTSPVRVGYTIRMGRFYYFLQEDGSLSMRGPGYTLLSPELASTSQSFRHFYLTEPETANIINKLTQSLTEDFVWLLKY